MKARGGQAILVLEDGRTFHGEAYGSVGETFGEAVFTTGDDRLPGDAHRPVLPPPGGGADRAAHRQHRGQRRGRRVRAGSGSPATWCATRPGPPSNWRATGDLEDRLAAEGVVGISGIDTRALTRHLRERGAMRVGVSSVERDPEALRERVLAAPRHGRRGPVGRGEHRRRRTRCEAEGEHRFTVAALDLGIKRNVARRLAARGVTTHVMPAVVHTGRPAGGRPGRGVLLARPGRPGHRRPPGRAGPGGACGRRLPLFGICFGSQILGRALGFGTYKLGYGHRGINQPVLDRTTGKVEVTVAQPRLRASTRRCDGRGRRPSSARSR